MLKFACKNGGKVELKRCASYLGKSYKVFELLFSMFEEAQIINIKEKAEDYYVVELTGNADISKVLHSQKYSLMLDLIDECEQFQKSLMEDDVYSLC